MSITKTFRAFSFATLFSMTAASALSTGCAGGPDDEGAGHPGGNGKGDSSALATFLTFQFSGSVDTDSAWNARSVIDDQLLFTIGHLNGNKSVGRLDKVAITNIKQTQVDGKTRITYDAKLPVAWGSKTNLPKTYDLTLPRDMSYAGKEAFTEKYKHDCVDFGAHDVDSGSMWYYYRPAASGCALDGADVVKVTATTSLSPTNSKDTYPEYDKVWADNALNVVLIFGKYEDGTTTDADAGIAGYNNFVKTMKKAFPGVRTTPANVSDKPGVANPDVTFTADLAGGKKMQVVALLVDNVRTTEPHFNQRYEELSTRADMIAYNGHAGLGDNVRALARKGKFVADQYLIMFMNGCDTFAYVDGSLAQKRAGLNPDDNADGSKYLDIVTNAMPSYFHSNATASTALISGLLSFAQPKTFEQIFSSIDTQQVVLVTGEEDNAFVPGTPIGPGTPPPPGPGYTRDEVGAVAKNAEQNYETPELPAGKYSVTLSHDTNAPGGDADLYVKAGAAPTLSSYDCRPYKNGSAEECTVTLAAPAKIYAKVVGYANQSNAYKLAFRSLAAPPPASWSGLNESGSVAKNEEKRFTTPELAAGTYTFAITGTGDADLYVKKGSAPSTASYDCRPYIGGSVETCNVTLTEKAAVHVMVRGYATQSTFTLTAQ